MVSKFTKKDIEERRFKIIRQARWCFLNFGYEKTSLEDIAKKADLSRTLLYNVFKNKEEIYLAVYEEWLISRHPDTIAATKTNKSSKEKLKDICRLMVIEPWIDMVDTPMGHEFFEACEKLSPDTQQRHKDVALNCIYKVIGNKNSAEVFVLALEGMLTDKPASKVLENRVDILINHFVK